MNEYDFTYTNSCTCANDDDENYSEYYCSGFCWENTLDDFVNITLHLFENNETSWWEVNDLRLWNRDVSGYFEADCIEKFIRGMTVNSEWIMRGKVFEDRIEYSLSHHDAPMGSNTVLKPVSEEKREKLGLY